MQCETCGKYIDRGKRVRLEGSVVVTCDECAKYGEIVGDVKPYVSQPKIQNIDKEENFDITVEKEIDEDYARIIREARENLGIKQEDLAKKINQPKSLIHRIESGGFEPKENLARTFEKILGVKLFVASEEKSKSEGKLKHDDKEVTLGDLVVIKKRIK